MNRLKSLRFGEANRERLIIFSLPDKLSSILRIGTLKHFAHVVKKNKIHFPPDAFSRRPSAGRFERMCRPAAASQAKGPGD